MGKNVGSKSLPIPGITCNNAVVANTRERVRKHREKLRKQGLRPIQIWVPDVRSPEFASQAHSQSLLAASSPHAEADQAFVDSISEFNS